MKRLIILDLDNTFYKYDVSHSSGLKSVYENQNIFKTYDDFILAYEDVKSSVHQEIPDSPSKHSKLIYLKKLFFNQLDNLEILNLENTYWNSFIKNVDLQKEGIKILSNNKTKDNLYVLFTNQNLNIQLQKIHAWKLNFFDYIITSEEAGHEKPSSEFFEFVSPTIEDLSRDKRKIYALGDSFENDIEYWVDYFDACGYLIDNNLSELKKNNKYIEASLNDSLKNIFNQNSNNNI
ncbi:HAD family hydrolase [Acidimicrobiia bacterium]|jgi:putative hydrolase of the HAD superfamily|nr:HAD family hydrolase [Acidimicrobiia bacterium]|tara:strand:+ start:834 stop:1538 length:705 start_codon:yes stop_codon:yes gene_type:complete